MSDNPRAGWVPPTGTPEATEALLRLAAAPAPSCHPVLCFHDKFREAADTDRYTRAVKALHAVLDEEQRALLRTVDRHSGDGWTAEQDRFVDELCRHFPGLAPAIRAVAWHHLDQQDPSDVGECCAGRDAGRSGRSAVAG